MSVDPADRTAAQRIEQSPSANQSIVLGTSLPPMDYIEGTTRADELLDLDGGEA